MILGYSSDLSEIPWEEYFVTPQSNLPHVPRRRVPCDPKGDSYCEKFLISDFACSHCFTGLRTYFVFSLAQLLPMLGVLGVPKMALGVPKSKF